jgi:hypothetical protein
VYPVTEWAFGVEVVQAFAGGEFAEQVAIASEMGPGVRPVYFIGGVPDPVRTAQEQAAAAYQAGTAQGQGLTPQLLVTILSS